MRGGVESDAVALQEEDAMEHRGCGALAVGARNMESRKPPLRMAEKRQSLLHPVEPQVDFPTAEVKDIMQCLGIRCHLSRQNDVD